MSHLADVITAALTEPQAPLWFPDCTDALVTLGYDLLFQRTGITREHYSTARVTAADASAPCHVVACQAFYPDATEGTDSLLIEWLSSHIARPYQALGLTFHTPEDIAATTVLPSLQEALNLLAVLPTLHHSVAKLVRVCHLLVPEDDDHDVSYSDPHLPFSIFVSISPRRQRHDVLRLVEAIVHEAMHLQLTLLEHASPLVRPSTEQYFSPWKGTYRSPQGVMHALYVFRVIAQCLERLLMLPGWSLGSIDYMRQRQCDIAAQVREIDMFKHSSALTALGTSLAHKLIDG